MSEHYLSSEAHKINISELNPDADHSVIIFGGITEGIDTERDLAEALAGEGFHVVSFDYPTEPAKMPQYRDKANYLPAWHAPKIEFASELLAGMVAQSPERKITVLAHSLGANIAAKAAHEFTDNIDRLILANPAGLFPDTFARLAGRFALENNRKSLTLTKAGRRQQKNGVRAILSDPHGFIGDAVDTAHADIRDDVKKLREAGIKVDVLVGAKDMVYPWDRIEKGLDVKQGMDLGELAVDSISSYFNTRVTKRGGKTKQHKLASKLAGHDQPIIYPEQTARLVRQIIEQ